MRHSQAERQCIFASINSVGKTDFEVKGVNTETKAKNMVLKVVTILQQQVVHIPGFNLNSICEGLHYDI